MSHAILNVLWFPRICAYRMPTDTSLSPTQPFFASRNCLLWAVGGSWSHRLRVMELGGRHIAMNLHETDHDASWKSALSFVVS